LFALGGVASADNAASISVAISYPCEQGEVCDETGVAVSRSFGFTETGPGDDVNIYITLLDANGNPATAGANGEDLADLTATVTSQLGDVVVPNTFLQGGDEATVSFNGDAAARAYVNYTDAEPGIDIINVDIIGGIVPLLGQAQVRVVAPDATALAVRTLDGDPAPSVIFESVSPPNNNGGNPATAGDTVTVTVIPHIAGEYTPAPNLLGQQVTVHAFADFDGSGTVGDDEDGIEATPIATATGTFASPVDVDLQLLNAGPSGLTVVFSAIAEDVNGNTIETPQPDEAPVSNGNFLVDTVTMNPGAADAIKVAEDVFENGNYIMEPDDDCRRILDDSGFCAGPGTPEDITIVIVDALGNAVDPAETVIVTGSLEGILDAQLSGCGTTAIGGYADTCTLQDTNGADAGTGVIIGPLTLSAPDLDGDVVSIYLMPADDCDVLDLFVTVDLPDVLATGPIAAGDTVVLNIESLGDTAIVSPGHDLLITGNSGTTLLSSDGCATQTTTLQIAAGDFVADPVTVELQVCGPATTAGGESVTLTVEDLDQCGASAMSDAIADVQPGDPTLLAVVGLDSDMESDSTLDETGNYVGTAPIVIDSFILADGATYTNILDVGDGGCDLQVWDPLTNVFDPTPNLTCITDSGNALPVDVDGCDVSVGFTPGAAGTDVLVTCSVETDDYLAEISRTFLLTNIVTEIPDGPSEPDDAATALTALKEGPQDTLGNQINPQPGGEAIIRIGVNGNLEVSSVNVRIEIAEGSAAGAELRRLDGTTITLPLTISITDLVDQRYVVYAPAAGSVTVTATEVSAEGLEPASITVVFGAQCEVTISPANPSVATETTQQFTATTACDGAAPPAYTWEIVAAETTGSTVCSGSTISATGLYTAADTEEECVDTIRATDTANGNATGETTVTVIPCAEAPVVTITPASPACEATEFCAATTLCGASVEGTYTWTVTGGTADTTSGDCINVTSFGLALLPFRVPTPTLHS
jgi:hypothetical protein